MERGLEEGRYRLREQHKAHELARRKFHDKPDNITPVQAGIWHVLDGETTYIVKESECPCDSKLNNHCKRDMCGACSYSFSCDCRHDTRSGISCAHIHAAVLYAPKNRLTMDEEEGRYLSTVPSPHFDENDSDDINRANQECDLNDPEDEPGPSTVDILDSNRDYMQRFDTAIAALRADMLSLSGIGNTPANESMSEVVAELERIRFMLKARTDEVCPNRKRKTMVRRAELQPVGRPPKPQPIRILTKAQLKKRANHTEPENVLLPKYRKDDIPYCSVCFRLQPDEEDGCNNIDWIQCCLCENWMHTACLHGSKFCPHDETPL